MHDPIEVTLRDDAATLEVQLHSESPQTVALLVAPQDQPANVRVFPNIQIQGSLTASGFAPGEYSVLALTNADDLEYRNPDVLRPYLSRAVHATLYANRVNKVEVAVPAQ
jgi:hypothetical protein